MISTLTNWFPMLRPTAPKLDNSRSVDQIIAEVQAGKIVSSTAGDTQPAKSNSDGIQPTPGKDDTPGQAPLDPNHPIYKDMPKHVSQYTRVHVVREPNDNRKELRGKLTPKCSGAYVFVTRDGSTYVGSGKALADRIITYFIACQYTPEVLRTVRQYFKDNGFEGLTVIVYEVLDNSKLHRVVLEQFLISVINPTLNMNRQIHRTNVDRRIYSGNKVFVYDTVTGLLVYFRGSHKALLRVTGINATTILKYQVGSGSLYRGRFVFSNNPLSYYDNSAPISTSQFQTLLAGTMLPGRDSSGRFTNGEGIGGSAISKGILATNVIDSALTKEYPSISAFVRAITPAGKSASPSNASRALKHGTLFRKEWLLTQLPT